MSFRGMLIKAGIDSNGTDIEIFNGYLKLNTENRLYFRDTSTFIYSSLAGTLRIEATTLILVGAMSFAGSIDITGDLTVGGDFNMGDASADSLLVSGRIATDGAEAYDAIGIDAITTSYTEGMDMRYLVTNWENGDTLSEFIGMYLRAETDTAAEADSSIYGSQVYGVTNGADITNVWGSLFYGYVKGAGAVTIEKLYGIQTEITWDAGGLEDTLSTEATPILAKVTAGVVDDDTHIHGMIIRMGDMDGGDRLFGNGILIQDDADMAGTSTFTVGLNIEIGCTTGIELSGALTTGINITGDGVVATGIDIGDCTTGIALTGAMTDGIVISGATGDNGVEITGVAQGDGILIDYTLPLAASRALNVNVDTAVAAGTTWAASITHTASVGGASIGGLVTTLNLATDHGGWAIGQFTQVDYNTASATHGMGVAGMFEILLPNGPAGGEYHVLALELAEAGASYSSFSTVNLPTSFIKFEVYGDVAVDINNDAYLFYLNGFANEADHLVSLTRQTIRIDVDEVERFIVLSQVQDGLGLGVVGTPMVLTADTNHAIDVFTESPDVAGIHLANRFYHTNTEDTTAGHWAMWVQNTVGGENVGSGALYVKLDCATYDAPLGGNSALNVEMVLANCTHAGGSYHPFVIDVDAGGPSLVMHGNPAHPCSFMKLEVYGDDIAEWNSKASVLTLSGITANTDHMFEAQDLNDPDFTHTLRINIGGVYYWIGLSSAKNFAA